MIWERFVEYRRQLRRQSSRVVLVELLLSIETRYANDEYWPQLREIGHERLRAIEAGEVPPAAPPSLQTPG